MFFHFSIFFLLQLVKYSVEDHYKGGTISWKPTDPTSISGPTVNIIITERQSWTLSRYQCNTTTINSFGVYNDTESTEPATLTCIDSTAICAASGYTEINAPLFCTDFSTVFQISSGTYYTQETLAISSVIDIAWRGVAWANETLANSWSLVSHIDLTPISGSKINTSPVSGSIPIFQTYVGVTTLIQIITGDVDDGQVVRCRWANQYPLDECGNVCLDLPNGTLDAVDCLIVWKPVLRAEDVANGLNSSTFVVALMVEDFENATSTTPLSSVPHQVLVYATYAPPNVCSTKPTVTSFGGRRNLACYAVGVGGTYTYNFEGTVSTLCPNNSIVDFISSSPLYTNKSTIYQISNYTWGVTVTWHTNVNETGLQPFCVAAVDNNGQASTQYCVMVVVGGVNPSIYTPQYVQGTATPLGTVMSTQMRFSIQATLPLRRTIINGTDINIIRINPNNTTSTVYTIDCKYSPDVYFFNNTLVFFVTKPAWTLGDTYYVTLSQGAVTADVYCGTEAGSFNGVDSWRFTIWNPSLSSTTTPATTTSTATTHTVTTRPLGTTTYNTLYTTTGIPAYITTTTTSTTSTTSTSVTSTTTTSATSTTTTTTTTTEYIPNADVIYPKDFEQDCLQPITITVALISAAVIPLHLFALINLFVKMNTHFQREALRLRNAYRKSLSNPIEHEEEEETFV